MRKISLALIVLTAFIFNGCIFNRLKKQEITYTPMQNSVEVEKNSLNKTEKNTTKLKKDINITKNSTKAEVLNKKMYANVKKNLKKRKKKKRVVKKSTKKSKHLAKKSTKKKKSYKKYAKKSTKKKKYTKKRKKYYEPYSLEKNELDPELLGPQTTILKNPLITIKPTKI